MFRGLKNVEQNWSQKKHRRNAHEGSNYGTTQGRISTTRVPRNVARLSCRFCRLEFESRMQFKLHLHEKHSAERNEESANKKCPDCFNDYSNGVQLIEHIVESHQSPPFRCHLCVKKFILSDGLIDHFKIVHLNMRGFEIDSD